MFDSIEIGNRYGRPQLAKMWGYAGHQALSRGVFTPSGRSEIILFVTRIKQASLRQYTDYLSGDILHWEGEDGHGNDARITAAAENEDNIRLFYREIHHSFFEYKGTLELIDHRLRTEKPSEFVFRLVHDQIPLDDIDRLSLGFRSSKETVREAVSKARLGQGLFRRKLLDLWGSCSVTGVKIPEILRASHIKPWRHSNDEERLDPYNGLFLLPQYDSLFDRGFISFDSDGSILVSRVLAGQDLSAIGISRADRLRFTREEHELFLSYHRKRILIV